MDKSKMLLVALGQGGGNILDGILEKDKNYNSLFINSSILDITPLKNATINKNVYIYPGSGGSGRDRSKGKNLIEENSNSIVETLNKYPQSEVIVILTSMAGGTGSGSLKTFIEITKKTFPSSVINLVAIMPSLSEDELSFKNTLECWNDINEVIDLINDIKFIDNNKRETYNEINLESASLLNLSFNIMGTHRDGSIDINDSLRINSAIGSSVILKLHDGMKDAKSALDLAIENSIFAQNNIYECDYLGINIKENSYLVKDLTKSIEVFNSTYVTYNNDFNIIILSGCEMPIEQIELIRIAYDERVNKRASRNKKRGFMVKI